MRPSVLVVTSSFDEHADIMCQKFEDFGAFVFRFDADNLDRYEICLTPTPPFLSLEDKKRQKKILAADVSSVWYRRPSPDRKFDKKLDGDSLKFFRGETKEWVKSITLSLKRAFWVTSPWLLYEARIKSNQLFVANSVGLSIPKTLIGRDQELVKKFFTECPNGMIAKSLKAPYVESKDSYYTLRTQEIMQTDLNDPSLFICPTIFQERISTLYELRVVVIGKRLFCFKAVPKEKTFLDIRTGGLMNVEYAPHEIAPSLSRKIIRLVDYFGLPFSSMDLLVDEDGKEFFIDLNPNGQWLWLEYSTGIVMSDLFAEMMVKGKKPK